MLRIHSRQFAQKSSHMDFQNYLAITHSHSRFCSPLSIKLVEQVSDLLQLKPGSRVLDLGCGKAEMMIRMASRWQIHGVGVDPSPHFIQSAHESMAELCPGADLHFHEAEPLAFQKTDEPWDVVLCINAIQQMDGYPNALNESRKFVESGGLIVMGTYFWNGTPEPELVSALGIELDGADYDARIHDGIEAGLIPVYAVPVAQDDLDHYHWVQVYGAEEYCAEYPDSTDIGGLREQIDMIRDSYRKIRQALGFGVFLFRNP